MIELYDPSRDEVREVTQEDWDKLETFVKTMSLWFKENASQKHKEFYAQYNKDKI